MKDRQLAIIKNARVAYEDHTHRDALWFDAFLSENLCTLLIVPLPDLPNIPGIKWDVSALNGQPCWVREEDNIIQFVDWWKQ